MNQLSEESLNHAHRKFLLKEIEKFEPFDSLLEFGCGAGANLALLANKYPEKQFFGYDINPMNISENIYKKLTGYCDNKANIFFLDFLDKVPIVDIVLVDAVFIYVEPDQISWQAEKLKAITKKAMLLFEWFTTNEPVWDEHWAHNWQKYLPGCDINVFHEIFPSPAPDPATAVPLDNGWRKWGAFITWLK